MKLSCYLFQVKFRAFYYFRQMIFLHSNLCYKYIIKLTTSVVDKKWETTATVSKLYASPCLHHVGGTACPTFSRLLRSLVLHLLEKPHLKLVFSTMKFIWNCVESVSRKNHSSTLLQICEQNGTTDECLELLPIALFKIVPMELLHKMVLVILFHCPTLTLPNHQLFSALQFCCMISQQKLRRSCMDRWNVPRSCW